MLHRLFKNCIMENHLKLAGEPELKVIIDKDYAFNSATEIMESTIWKALDFSSESFYNCCKRLMHLFKAWSRDKL